MPETVTARAIIVDPEPFFHERVRACLSKGTYDIVGEAPNSEVALQQLGTLHPEFVVLGPHLQEDSGFALSREITHHAPIVKTIIFTAHTDDLLFQADAAYSGIVACLARTMTDEECLAVVANVMAGHQSFSREILTLAFQSIRLTPREREVLKLISEEKTDQEIASTLALKRATIHNYSQSILEKLGVHDRHEVVRRARRRGLV